MSTSSMVSAGQNATVVFLSGDNIAKFIDFSMMTLIFYDWLICFSWERIYVWPSNRLTGKALYFLARYGPFVDLPMLIAFRFSATLSVDACLSLYYTQSALYAFGVMVAEVILVSRAHAVWNRHRWIGRALVVGLLAVLFFLAGGLSKSLSTVSPGLPPSPLITGCHPARGSKILILNYISVVVFEFVMMILAIIKGYANRGQSSIWETFHRDGVCYFIYLFALSLGNAIALFHMPPGVGGALSTSYRNLHSIVSCRLILHLRMEYAKNTLASSMNGNSTVRSSTHNSEPFGDRDIESIRFSQNSQETRDMYRFTRRVAEAIHHDVQQPEENGDSYSMTSSLEFHGCGASR